jgi:cell division protein FtsN
MNYRDEFDEPPRSGFGFLGNVGPKAAFFIVLIALSFMIGVVWKLYTGGTANQGQEVPIVRADDNPFKVVPDEPGGMKIPYKDSTIFSSLNNDQDRRIENLLADEDDEEPMPRSQLFAGLNTDQVPELNTEAQETPLDQPLRSKIDAEEDHERLSEMTKEAKHVVEEMIDGGVESVMPKPSEVKVTKDVAPKVEVKTKPAPKPTPAPVTTVVSSTGDYYVQLGSVKTADGAESEWKKIAAKYPSILSGYNHRVETADLGEKGTFYRIQAGPVSKDKAVSTCEAIKKINSNGCLLKKK